MIFRLTSNESTSACARLSFGSALLTMALAVASGPTLASNNTSGRFVVADTAGGWRAVDPGSPAAADSVFYPSWYIGMNLASSQWSDDDLEFDSKGVGLVAGNHFAPHWRWELRHRYQSADGVGAQAVEAHSLSSLSVDYLVAAPQDGISPVLRLGYAQSSGGNLNDDQTEGAALAGLGLQWREDRWLLRAMAEQMGENQHWVGVTLAAYLGGGQSVRALPAAPAVEATAVAAVAPEEAPAPVDLNEQKAPADEPAVELAAQPEPAVAEAAAPPDVASELATLGSAADTTENDPATLLDSPAVVATAPVSNTAPEVQAPRPAPRLDSSCARVFATRVLNGIKFSSPSSANLTPRSANQLAQIGASYAKRSYVTVAVDLAASESINLAAKRGRAVMAALNASGDLDGRIETHTSTGAETLSLSMKDTRRCP